MTKFNERFKRSVVKQCESGQSTYAAIAQRNGVSVSMVKLWVALHKRHGMAGLRKKFDHYDVAFRLRALKQMWKNHWSYGETAVALGIRSAGSLAVWERCYHSGGIDALKPRKRGRSPKMPDLSTIPTPTTIEDESRSKKDLLAEIDQLRMENAYLKKLEALVQEQKLQKASVRKKRK